VRGRISSTVTLPDEFLERRQNRVLLIIPSEIEPYAGINENLKHEMLSSSFIYRDYMASSLATSAFGLSSTILKQATEPSRIRERLARVGDVETLIPRSRRSGSFWKQTF
jgi:hypothetical protein